MAKNPASENERRDRLRPLKVWVSALERQAIEGRAASACLSLSGYLRAAALSHSIKRIYDLAAVEQLAILGRDLSRLGQLLAARLGDGGVAGEGGNGKAVQDLLGETRVLQQQLLELMTRT